MATRSSSVSVVGNRDLDGDQQVAPTVVGGCAAVAHPERPARGGAGRDADRHRVALDGRHLDVGPERRLGEGDRHGDGHVVAIAPEHRVWLDVHPHVEVARRAVVTTGCSLALEPDRLAVADAGRDAHLDHAGPGRDAGARAGRAGRVDEHAPPAAVRAGPAEGEEALVVVEHAASVAVGTDPRRGAWRGARPLAVGARHLAHQVHRRGDALDAVEELEVQVGLEVGATLGPTAERAARAVARAPRRDRTGCPAGRRCRGVEARAAPATAAGPGPGARHRTHRPDLVVLLASLGVTDHVVGRGDRLELLLGRLDRRGWRRGAAGARSFRYAVVMSFCDAPEGTPRMA